MCEYSTAFVLSVIYLCYLKKRVEKPPVFFCDLSLSLLEMRRVCKEFLFELACEPD